MKTISIITPCYNEEDNVVELYTRAEIATGERLPPVKSGSRRILCNP